MATLVAGLTRGKNRQSELFGGAGGPTAAIRVQFLPGWARQTRKLTARPTCGATWVAVTTPLSSVNIVLVLATGHHAGVLRRSSVPFTVNTSIGKLVETASLTGVMTELLDASAAHKQP